MSPSTGAIEKQKLVYILNRDAAARLTISSPLEAHKANTLVYHVVGVDVGFENPMFACLEMDYEVMVGGVSISLPTFSFPSLLPVSLLWVSSTHFCASLRLFSSLCISYILLAHSFFFSIPNTFLKYFGVFQNLPDLNSLPVETGYLLGKAP